MTRAVPRPARDAAMDTPADAAAQIEATAQSGSRHSPGLRFLPKAVRAQGLDRYYP